MRKILLRGLSILAVGIACISSGFAQEFSMKELPLNDMSSFKPQAGNWRIVGEVTMNPNVDIHKPAAEAEGKRKKRRKNRDKSAETPQAVTYQPGEGILLNINDDTKKDNLVTAWEHGDIELEFEVMLPKGSNSGIYLQGRYEVQLFDSWGQENASFSDIGGIYRNWEQGQGSYMGKAPLVNAAKAPGLWQSMKISFRAPRFNEEGEKIANARFVSVELNGVKIHDNVEVPLPTGGPIENNEQPMGPLMIQGDHGPVAFRNIKYRLMHDSDVSISDLTYKVYEGSFEKIADFASAEPVKTGSIPKLTWEVAGMDDAFGLSYSGNIIAPEDGTYHFRLHFNGGAKLVIDGQTLVDQQQPSRNGQQENAAITLDKGTYPFELYYYKDASWLSPRLGLFSTDTYPEALHAFNSFPPDTEMEAPIHVKVGGEVEMLRAFLDFKGERERRHTHTIGIGDPGGVHYIYDLKAGNLLCVWRGRFVNATPMWHNRGDGSFEPLGMVQYLFTSPSLAVLSTSGTAFPEKNDTSDFRGNGYELEEATGRPVFKYIYKGMEVEDRIYPDDSDRMIIREVLVKNNTDQQDLYFKFAEGAAIEQLPDGAYIIGDKEYYIKVLSPAVPEIREVNGKKELVAPVNGHPVKYSITW